ncbi:MAG: GntR family transcriptional regulator [Celeribacter sp.]
MKHTAIQERGQVHKMILDEILSGRIVPGAPLSERGLAERLSVGRTPVREALRDLINSGVLESLPARGTFVRQMTLGEVREAYEVRYALEGMAAHLAAVHGPLPELLSYEERFYDMAARFDEFDVKEVYSYGAEFHLAIFRSARNATLQQVYEPIRLRFAMTLRLPQYYDPEWVFRSIEEHLGILDAIKARDGAAAQAKIIAHMSAGLEARLQIFRRMKDYAPVADYGDSS